MLNFTFVFGIIIYLCLCLISIFFVAFFTLSIDELSLVGLALDLVD